MKCFKIGLTLLIWVLSIFGLTAQPTLTGKLGTGNVAIGIGHYENENPVGAIAMFEISNDYSFIGKESVTISSKPHGVFRVGITVNEGKTAISLRGYSFGPVRDGGVLTVNIDQTIFSSWDDENRLMLGIEFNATSFAVNVSYILGAKYSSGSCFQ